MARRATLTHEALVALGPDKLAKLVVDEAGRNAGFKRIVNAALAGARGPDAVAAVVNRRLSALQKARGLSTGRSARPSSRISGQRSRLSQTSSGRPILFWPLSRPCAF
jgi:hypothetical protein